MRLSSFAPLLILSLIVSLVACKSSATQSKSGPSTGPAGEVMEVEGDVSARRGSADQRDLEVGHVVYAEDLVHTGPKASVTIYLAHNGALHNIGAEQDIEIEGSLAWTAVSKSESAFDQISREESTAAAAAHAEKSAANEPPKEEKTGSPRRSRLDAGDKSKRPGSGIVSIPKPIPNDKPETTPINKPDVSRDNEEGSAGESAGESAANYQWPARRGVSGKTGASPPTSQPRSDEEESATGKTGKAGKAGKAGSKPLLSPQRVVLELAKSCQTEHKGSGGFELILRFSNSKIVELRTKGPKELTKTLSCLREKLRAVGSKPKKASWSFSLKL